MSETRDLNSTGSAPTDPEQLLKNLTPQPLELNRDDLFFRAGYDAGARHSRLSLAWPSTAAALLMVSIGLSAALVHQTTTLPDATADLGVPSGATAALPSSATDQRLRDWQRLASPSSPPPGKLTALGWIESATASPTDQPQPENKPSPSLRHPPTYFELLRNYRES